MPLRRSSSVALYSYSNCKPRSLHTLIILSSSRLSPQSHSRKLRSYLVCESIAGNGGGCHATTHYSVGTLMVLMFTQRRSNHTMICHHLAPRSPSGSILYASWADRHMLAATSRSSAELTCACRFPTSMALLTIEQN